MGLASDPCPGCGHHAGRVACQEVFNDVSLRVRALAWTDSLKTWRLMHDVYDLQHAEEFCTNHRELVMHLGGVCWALEHGGAERGYRALQKLVDLNPWKDHPYPPAPGLPGNRGAITVVSLASLTEPQLLVSGVDRWARAVWLAYASLQPFARECVVQAIGQMK